MAIWGSQPLRTRFSGRVGLLGATARLGLARSFIGGAGGVSGTHRPEWPRGSEERRWDSQPAERGGSPRTLTGSETGSESDGEDRGHRGHRARSADEGRRTRARRCCREGDLVSALFDREVMGLADRGGASNLIGDRWADIAAAHVGDVDRYRTPPSCRRPAAATHRPGGPTRRHAGGGGGRLETRAAESGPAR